jgi:hypothetical protein
VIEKNTIFGATQTKPGHSYFVRALEIFTFLTVVFQLSIKKKRFLAHQPMLNGKT